MDNWLCKTNLWEIKMGESDLCEGGIEAIYAVCSPHVAAWVVPAGSTFCNQCGLYLYSFLVYFLLVLSLLAFSVGEAQKKRFLC